MIPEDQARQLERQTSAEDLLRQSMQNRLTCDDAGLVVDETVVSEVMGSDLSLPGDERPPAAWANASAGQTRCRMTDRDQRAVRGLADEGAAGLGSLENLTKRQAVVDLHLASCG